MNSLETSQRLYLYIQSAKSVKIDWNKHIFLLIEQRHQHNVKWHPYIIHWIPINMYRFLVIINIDGLEVAITNSYY